MDHRAGILLSLAIVALLGIARAARATEGCTSSVAVLREQAFDPLTGGAWRMPASVDRPEVVTHAAIAVASLPPDSTRKLWALRIQFAFPDPKPLGIPYSFEKLELRWQDADGPHRAILDWTDACTHPGPALYPGQMGQQTWEIPDTESLKSLQYPTLSVWGQRF